MTITHLTSVSQLDRILSASNDKLSVIDFHATWCGPCHAIAPTFEALAKQFTNVNFLKCDVDAAKDVAFTYRVTAMPTFIFLRGTKQVHMIKGADRLGLQNAVKQFVSESSSPAFTGKGQTLGGSSPSSPSMPSMPSTREVTSNTSSLWSEMDPQVKILLGLLAAYVFFWLM
ncbi:thioredoxin-like protein [Phlebopus sp. FC_14]|nr:thioredoxin-like protein [Phlebopus sp. FC_14]